jgi:hypothetical protein
MFMLREYPTTIEECFQSPVEGAIYAETVDKLRAGGAICPWKLDRSALTHTCWDLGSPVNTAVWYFQLGPAGEIRVIDCDLDLDLTPVERIARMLGRIPLRQHFLPHDAMQTQKSGVHSLTNSRRRVWPTARRCRESQTSGSASTASSRCCRDSASGSRNASGDSRP